MRTQGQGSRKLSPTGNASSTYYRDGRNRIYDNEVSYNGQRGITIWNSSGNEIIGNHLHDNFVGDASYTKFDDVAVS